MITIALQPVPNQTVSCAAGGQQLRLAIYHRLGKIYMDVNCNGTDIANGAICLNGAKVVKSAYLMVGNLAIVDIQGANDPEYSGLGSRYLLIYDEQL